MHNPVIFFRSFSELKEWQAFHFETRLLEEVYYPMWYHFHVDVSWHKDIAVWMSGSWRIECHNNPEYRGTMREMVCDFRTKHEGWVIGIKADNPESDYHIGVCCPNQDKEKGSIYHAMIDNRCAYSYRDLTDAVDALAYIVRTILDTDVEPQWLEIGG